MKATTTAPASSVFFGSSVLQTAGWCGLVSALVCLFAVLNFVPPVAVHYDFKTQVILSPERVQQLEAAVRQSTVRASVDGEPGNLEPAQAQLLKVVRLDQLQPIAGDGAATGRSSLILVEITSRWAQLQSTETLYGWIESQSAVQVKRDDTNLARQLRFNRWMVTAAQHYVDRHQYVEASQQQLPASNGRTFQLASTAVASSDDSVNVETTVNHQKEADDLLLHVEQAQKRLAASLARWEHHVDSESGEFRPAGKHAIEAKPSRIPAHFAVSLLVLGLATGSVAGWLQFRLQSGGAYVPAAVALQLSRDGLPCVGNVVLAGVNTTESVRLYQKLAIAVRSLPRQFGQRLSRLSEWALLAWCCLIAFRLLTDPLWRDVFANSPLAAFGRLISGLP